MKNTLQVATPGDREIVVTRSFHAPREVVWEAMSSPEFLRRWVLGPPGWEMTVCDEDQRVGGHFRWAWRGPQGAEFSMHGVYHEVIPPEKGSRTEIFEGMGIPEGAEQFATLVLSENGQATDLTITLLYGSKEARDGALASGMAQGMSAGYDRLDDILADVS